MNFLRKMLLVFLGALLPFFLFALAVDTSIIRATGSSDPIKKILANSGIYDSIISSALDQAKSEVGSQDDVNLSDQTVKTIAERTFTPQFLKENTEQVLDSIYLWLDGKTTLPNFKIDLSSLKTTFAVEAAKVAQERAATLPACPAGLSGSADNFEPFSATCLPRSLTPALVNDQVKNSLSSGEGFLENPVITADTIKVSGSNQSVFADQLKDVPNYYQQVKKTPIYLAILSLLIALGVIFLSSSRRAGLRRVGIILVIVGTLLLIFAWVLNWGVNQKALPQLELENKVLQEKLKTLASDITANIDKTFWTFGGAYAALGVLAIAVPLFVHRRNGHAVHEPAPAEHVPAEGHRPEEPEPKPRPPKKPPAKIQ